MKNLDDPHPTPSGSIADLEADKVRCLIAAVAKVADARLDLSERRTEILTRLLEMGESAGVQWAWGVTDKAVTSPAPVASIEVGFTASEKTAVIKTGLDPRRVTRARLETNAGPSTGVYAVYNSAIRYVGRSAMEVDSDVRQSYDWRS